MLLRFAVKLELPAKLALPATWPHDVMYPNLCQPFVLAHLAAVQAQ